MDPNIQGNTAVVTAAGSGLGKATAKVFGQQGVDVVINDIDGENLKASADEIRQTSASGVEVVPVQGDLTREGDMEALVETTVENFGGVDHIVTSAGGPPPGPFMETNDDDWYFAFDLLLMSVVRLCREAYPYLKEGDGGTIVNSTSRSVKEAIDGLVLSNSIRSGVAGLAKTLSKEFAPEVRTNIVLPGPHETQRQVDLINDGIERGEFETYEEGLRKKAEDIPLGEIGDPMDYGRFVVLLSSPLANYINGTAIPIDGGEMASNV